MDAEFIIKDEANKFCSNLQNMEYLSDGVSEFINNLESELFRFDENVDKLIYLYQVIINLNQGLEKHLKNCRHKDNPKRCDNNKFYYKSIFFAEQEIRKLNPSFEFSILRPNINSYLVKQNLIQLSNFPDVAKIYQTALDKLNMGKYERNLLDDLRLSLELLLKKILSNDKSIEKQKSYIGAYFKQKNTSKEIINMFITLIDYFSKYQNDYIKHNDNVKKEEIDFMLNLTGAFINFVINLN